MTELGPSEKNVCFVYADSALQSAEASYSWDSESAVGVMNKCWMLPQIYFLPVLLTFHTVQWDSYQQKVGKSEGYGDKTVSAVAESSFSATVQLY